MRKDAVGEFGTAIWITSDGKRIRAENHLENLVSRMFDLDSLKRKYEEFVGMRYVSESEFEDLKQYGYHLEPDAPELIPDELERELIYFDSLEPIQIGELPVIAQRLGQIAGSEFKEALLALIPQASTKGFERVVLGEEQPYHFAFRQGDIRVRLFSNAFVAELASSRLNRHTAGRIIDALFSLIGTNIKNAPQMFVLDLVDFSGEEPVTRSYEFQNMDDFFGALSDLTRRRVAEPIELLLKLATIFYQRVKERHNHETEVDT